MRYTSMGWPSDVGTMGMFWVYILVDRWYYLFRTEKAGHLGYAFRQVPNPTLDRRRVRWGKVARRAGYVNSTTV